MKKYEKARKLINLFASSNAPPSQIPSVPNRFQKWAQSLGLLEKGESVDCLTINHKQLIQKALNGQFNQNKLIHLDVKRTFPEFALARSQSFRKAMTAVLQMLQTSQHKDFYMQGMNQMAFIVLAVRLCQKLRVSMSVLIEQNEVQVEQAVIFESFVVLRGLIERVNKSFSLQELGDISVHLSELTALLHECNPEILLSLKVKQVQLIQFVFRWLYMSFIGVFRPEVAVRYLDWLLQASEVKPFAFSFATVLLCRLQEQLRSCSTLAECMALLGPGIEHKSNQMETLCERSALLMMSLDSK